MKGGHIVSYITMESATLFVAAGFIPWVAVVAAFFVRDRHARVRFITYAIVAICLAAFVADKALPREKDNPARFAPAFLGTVGTIPAMIMAVLAAPRLGRDRTLLLSVGGALVALIALGTSVTMLAVGGELHGSQPFDPQWFHQPPLLGMAMLGFVLSAVAARARGQPSTGDSA